MRHKRRAYLLLETTIATGLLIAGLAVIGAQVQQAESSVREMELQLRALMLAETKLAELDLGLVELDSVDPIQEEDFGPRYPDFGWRLITEETSIEQLYHLTFEVLFLRSDGYYEPDSFDHENARELHTVYALRTLPQELDLAVEFGLEEEEAVELGEKLDLLAIPGLSIDAFDPTVFPLLPFDEFLEVLPIIGSILGIDLTQMASQLPPDILDVLKDSGLLEPESEGGREGDGGGGDSTFGGES
ncbi:MAG: hypothetical protein JSU63_02610 [Phycisphaerales bacterium]|nr:MAG: hypothetical protein JSU63_02610 [Phycisphaerales bacterium]